MADVGRNDPCPCGSGKKYKKCCEAKDQAKTHATLEKQWKNAEKEFAKTQEKEAESGAKPAAESNNPASKKAESSKAAPPKHNTFVAPKMNMPRRSGGG